MSLQAIYRYEIAFSFDVDKETTFEEISRKCNIDESDVRRLLRMATANHIFHEPRKGVIAHSSLSKMIVEVPYVHAFIGLVCDLMWPAGTRTIDAMQKWPGSEEPTHTGVSLNSSSGDSLWDMFKNDTAMGKRFADAMMFLQTAPVFSLDHLVHDLKWGDEGSPGVLVDVGGSLGSVCTRLARQRPNLKCIVQDLPETINEASIPEDLEGRLEFMAHNFFEEQPVKNADVYFLRSILHDWSDKYAILILQNLIPALKSNAKIIINEVCVPEPNTLGFYQEHLLR
jgi:hypothetical protein